MTAQPVTTRCRHQRARMLSIADEMRGHYAASLFSSKSPHEISEDELAKTAPQKWPVICDDCGAEVAPESFWKWHDKHTPFTVAELSHPLTGPETGGGA